MVLLFLTVSFLQANDKDIALLDFANKVSLQNNINIYIDEDLKKKKISLYVPNSITNKELFSVFSNTVSKLNLSFVQIGSTYYLTKKIKEVSSKYLYKLKYNSFKDCDKVLKSFGLKYSYLNDSNTFIMTCTKKKYNLIKQYLKMVDVKQNQVVLKIKIFEFNDINLKERGVQYSSIYQNELGVTEVALNALIAPLSTTTHTLSNTEFYGALKLLNEHNLIDVKQFPYITARNNDKFKFEAVENVPYLVSTTITDATNTSEQTSIEYKDIGLKINGTSFIYNDYITLDIDLIIEDFINSSLETNTPQTYKRHLNSRSNINYNDVLLLSGIKRTKHEVTNYNIPFLSNIPYLGEIFKYKSDSDSELNIVIAIEVIKSKDFDSKEFINHTLSEVKDIINEI